MKSSFISILGVVIICSATFAGWHTEYVDGTLFGYMSSTKIDSQGRTHISGFDEGGKRLLYLCRDNVGWHTEVVDDEGDVGYCTSLALTTDGYPHIAYADYSESVLKYAYKDGSGWHTEIVDSEAPVGSYASIALDSRGMPHIAYMKERNNEHLKYVYRDSSGWHIEIVDSDENVGWYVSISIDTLDNPHISYFQISVDSSDSNLRYAFKNEDEWQIELVDQYGHYGYSSIAVDSENRPHIGYCGGPGSGNHNLRYAYRDQTGWQIEDLDMYADYISINLDSEGYMHIVYQSDSKKQVKYARQNAGGWTFFVLDENRFGTGTSISADLDRNNFPHISYLRDPEVSDGEFVYLFQNQSGWHYEFVNAIQRVGYNPSIAIDSYGEVHICHHDHKHDDLRYSFKDQFGWHNLIVDSEDFVGSGNSLALDASGLPHISYTEHNADCDDGQLKYAYLDKSGWNIEIVSPEGEVGSWTSIKLDESGIPHIAYYEWLKNDLNYAYRDHLGWHTETVDFEGEVGSSPSLELNRDGVPRISYCDDTSHTVKYARKENDHWQIEIVGYVQGGKFAADTSLALDSSGNPHISYADVYGHQIVYAHKNHEGWHLEIIDSSDYKVYLATLELDSRDRPHVCYTDNKLRYAYRDSTNWRFEVVDSDVLIHCSMLLDANDTPHICYPADYITLRYAVRKDPWVELKMPSVYFNPHDPCSLSATLSCSGDFTFTQVLLFVFLAIEGNFYFAPSFDGTDYYSVDIPLEGEEEIIVLDEFFWPENAGNVSEVVWYAAVTDPRVTTVLSNIDSWRFGWGE